MTTDWTLLHDNTLHSPGVPIDSIKVGKRHRRDLGNLDSLAASIADHGLLHPIVITPDSQLIAGERRLEALKRLGWKYAPVRVVDLDAIVRGELAENALRKDFTPSEMVAIAATVERRERELAKERMTLGKVCTGSGKTRDKVAAPLGVSGYTLEKARAIVEAAAAEPERFGKLLEDMDRTNKVNGVHKRLCIMRQAEAIRAEPPPLPGKGPYRVLVADPPWPYEIRREDPSHRATYPYPQMSIAEICALNVASIAAPDSILWLWTTNYHMLNGARDVLDAWGFAPVTILTWAKNKYGMGAWLRGQTEHCILATRGKPTVELSSQSTLLFADVRAHSQKPEEFYRLVENLCPAPRYAYLFSRYRHNDKWDCHGDEAPQAIEAAE
jgi:N6-adenosine-specific RNA methylase IME4/ParB-like chromosome segregation protein Spo0J